MMGANLGSGGPRPPAEVTPLDDHQATESALGIRVNRHQGKGDKMAVYRIGYDLNYPGQNYPELTAALSRVGKRLLRSDWIVEVNQTAEQVRDAVRSHIDPGDHVVVTAIPVGSDWATWTRQDNAGVALLQRLRP